MHSLVLLVLPKTISVLILNDIDFFYWKVSEKAFHRKSVFEFMLSEV